MKKIYFGSKQAPSGGNEPFWKPWGAAGYLGRLLLFLVLLFALILILNLFKKINKPNYYADIPDEIIRPDGPDPIRVPVDTTINFPRDIQNPSPNLPRPEDNQIPPFDEDDIVTDDDTGQQIVGNRLNVILDSDANDETFNKFADEFKELYPGDEYKILSYDPLTKTLQLQVPEPERDTMLQQLPQQMSDIAFLVFPESVMGSFAEHPNDPAFQYPDYSWHFAPIQAYEAWEITKGSPDVTVAIIDSYFDLNHDELNSDRIVKPYSVWRRSGNVAPPEEGCDDAPFKHGTLVACTTLGNINNGRGTAGIAPDCKFMPISAGHQMTSMTLLQGMLYAIYQGANVVNISAGDAYPEGCPIYQLSPEEQKQLSDEWRKEEEAVWNYAFDLANARNVTIVWAAGNEALFTALDPSKRGDRSIKVSAVDTNLRKAEFSNYGNFPDQDVFESTISAPGVNIFGACPYNDYIPLEWGAGTSFAAPIVAGAVALMKSIDPTLTTAEIIAILKETGKPVQGAPDIGNLIQIKDALQRVKDNFVSFDDIMRDHSKFIGLWRSTTLLHRTENGVIHNEDEIRMYFQIDSEANGQFILCEVRPKDDYISPITISWGSDRIEMQMIGQAVCEGRVRKYDQLNFTCTADTSQSRLIMCSHYSNGEPVYYKLRKVSERDDD
jgi:subtilisin family serine protease